jgi:curli biogenesis system outer membrane secretion channel CsgG
MATRTLRGIGILLVTLLIMSATKIVSSDLVCAWAAPAQEAIKPRIAIKTFENPASYYNSTIGNALTEIMVTDLARTGKFAIVERQAVDELLKEIEFGGTEWAKSPAFAAKGQLLGAEYLLFGKVTNFSYKESSVDREVYVIGKGRRTETKYLQEADVRIDFRLANIKTGEIILSEAGVARRTSESERSEMEIWRLVLRSQSLTGEWSSSLIGRATVDAVRNVVRKLSDLASEVAGYVAAEALENLIQRLSGLEGKIMGAIGSDEFVVNLGTKEELTIGDQLTVFAEIPIKNKKGEVIYSERKELGKLEITDVSFANDRAKARFIEASAEAPAGLQPKEGDILKVDLTRARTVRGITESSASVESLLHKGDRYLEDNYFSQALQQFQQANELKPNDPAILARIAKAQLFLRNFYELETIFKSMLGQAMPITVDVYHHHFLGSCFGTLSIEKGRLSYHPQKGDHGFQLSPHEIGRIEVSEKEASFLHLRFLGADNKEKKYNFTPAVFVVRPEKTQVVTQIMVDESDREDCLRLLRLLQRLCSEYVK